MIGPDSNECYIVIVDVVVRDRGLRLNYFWKLTYVGLVC